MIQYKNATLGFQDISDAVFLDRYVVIDQGKIDAIANEYFEKLESWRSVFKLEGNLDRHKVGALTMFYFLKYMPVSVLPIASNWACARWINERVCLRIGVARLDLQGKPMVLPEKLQATIWDICSRFAAEWQSGKFTHDQMIIAVKALAAILFVIEERSCAAPHF